MIHRDYLIIGAGVAGASVCEGIRGYDKKGSVTLVGNEPYLPYMRPPLSGPFLKEKAPSIEKLYHLPEEWYQKNKIEVRSGTVVTHFNIERRLAVLGNGQTIEFKKACLATGSRPHRPQVAGSNLGNIIYLRTLRDALALREVADTENAMVVIGGGHTAAEVAATLCQLKKKVTLMCRDLYLWQGWLGTETAKWLTGIMESNGINLMMGETLNGFEGKTVLRNIQTKSGNRFNAGVALVALGYDLNLELVHNTPLSSPNGTPVNELLETDEKGIYAVGDIALFPDSVLGGVRRFAHWESGVLQGRLAGANITGKKRQRFQYLAHHTSEVFDLKFDFIGDFSLPPGRIEMEGDYGKRSFTDLHYQGDRLVAAVTCNRTAEQVEKVRDLFLGAVA